MKTLATLAMLSFAAAANGAITANAGNTTFLSTPPSNAQQFNLTGSNATCWNEQSSVTSSGTVVNLTSAGTYTGSAANVGVISGTFDSHFIHFDPGSNSGSIGGMVWFSGAIRGIIYDQNLLSTSDSTFGAGGTTYDTGNALRSRGGNALANNLIGFAGNTMNFSITVGWPGQINRMFEIRVLTEVVPTPGTGAMALAGGLLAVRRRR